MEDTAVALRVNHLFVQGSKMQLTHCTYENNARDILEILNDAILNTTALYDYHPRSFETMAIWFKTKEAGAFPVIGAFDEHGHDQTCRL